MAAKKTAAKKDKRSKKHRAAGKDISNRPKAEREFPRGAAQPERMSEADAAAMIHELQVHQIDLETQNEELRTVQKQLEDSRRKYADLYDFAPVGYFTFDKEGYIIEANLTGCQMLGVEKIKLIEKPFSSFVSRGSQDKFYRYRGTALTPGLKQTCEITLVRKDGQKFEAQLESIPAADAEGNLTLCRTAITDITERKQAEAALRQSEHQLARSQEIAHLGSWELDLVNDQLSWSDEVYRIFGLQPQEFGATYEAFLERVHPDDRALVDEAYSSSIREGRDTYEIEHRVVQKDTGDIRWVHEKCEHFRDAAGKIIRSVGMVHEITDQKRAVEQIEMAARFPSENPSPILRIASDGMILYSNGPGSCLLKEWGREVGEKAPPDWCKRVAQALDSGRNIVRQVKCGKRIVSVEAVPVSKGGYVNLYGRDITKERRAGQALRRAHAELEMKVQKRTEELAQTVGILREEVEQRMRAEEAVKAERHRFSDVLETLPAYICLLTPDYYMPFANRVFREWFGYYPNKKCYEFLFNRTEPCEICETYSVLKTMKPHRWEWTGPNGRNYDIFDFPFEDTDGSLLILEMGIDVTEQKRMQEELRSASLYTRSLIEASLDPLVTVSPDGRITDVSDATVKVTGVPREQLIGTDFSDYFTERKKAREGYRRVFAEGFVRDYPLTIRHRDGHLTDVLYNATIYRDTRGNVAGIFAAARDVTEKKIAEAELERYRLHLEDLVKQRTQELARSNRDLEQFAYVASHDLQEPLRAVAGFVELLRQNLKNSLNVKTTKYMDFAVDGAVRMQSLISDLLEYSRIGTRGKEPQQTDAGAALKRAMANLEISISESGAEITSDSLPAVCFDDVQLSQLFQNLISNALKFRGEQSPRIHISAVKLDDRWRFSVADNGIGIDPQYAERIFLIFQRLHSREEYPGTGIGLSICKKIVERHNGKMWVESKPGDGSTFYFTVPDKGETN